MNMRHRLLSFGLQILAIEVDALGILAPIDREPGWIQAGQHAEAKVGRPLIFLQQLADCQRPRRFITVDTGRNIDARVMRDSRLCRALAETGCRTQKGKQVGLWCGGHFFDTPPSRARCVKAIAEHCVDINSFAEITVDIFPKPLHRMLPGFYHRLHAGGNWNHKSLRCGSVCLLAPDEMQHEPPLQQFALQGLGRSAAKSRTGSTGRTISYFCSSNLRTSWIPDSLLTAQKSIAAVELRKSMASRLMRVQEPTSLK